jgi:hypothetical protein
MTEVHALEVRWSGPLATVDVLKAAAEGHGAEVTVETASNQATLRISITDDDLQSLRDRVDALLVVLSAAEEALG